MPVPRMSAAEAIKAALPLLATGEKDNAIAAKLQAGGATSTLAEEVLAFVPLAFGRQFLDGLGITFSDDFATMRDGRQVTRPLESRPVYQAARAAAAEALQRRSSLFPMVALRSSECHAVNQALNAGSDPKNLVCSAPVLLRVDPDDVTPAPKRWWWPF